MRLSRPWKLALGLLACLIVLAVLYAAFLAWQVERALSQANDDAHALEAAVQSGDKGALATAASEFANDAHHAHTDAHNPIWGALTHLPFIGDDARGVRTVADVAQQLGTNGVGQLATAASQVDQLLPKGGSIDLSLVAKMQPEVAQGDTALASARTQLASQDPSHFLGPLRTKYTALEATVDGAATAMSSADKAMQVLPTMLGAHGAKSYLLVFDNNAEIRAGGGLPGSVSLLDADQGRLTLVKQVPGEALGQSAQPVLPLSNAEQTLWGQQLGTWFLDANLTPDYDRTAALMKARWEQVQGGHVDGVATIDPVTLSYILGATGPITVDGVTLSSSTAVDYLLHQVYIDRPQPAAQDAFFGDVAQAFFQKVTGGAGSAQGVIKALARGTQEHRVDVHSFDGSVQQVLDGTEIAGQLPTKASADPQVGLYLNDSTASKMSYYLRYQASVAPTYCNAGTQELTGDATISSTAPANAATSLPPYVTGAGAGGIPAGHELVSVLLFGPIGGKIQSVSVDGQKQAALGLAQYEGRPVARTFVELTPGASDHVTWTMQSGPGQTGDVHTLVTPSIVAGSQSSVSPSVCG